MNTEKGRKIAIFAGVLALVLLAIGALALGRMRQNRTTLAGLETAILQRGDLEITVDADGILRSNQSALLAWKTSGTVDKVQAALGEQVEAGQELASLSETSLPQPVILAQVELINAQRQLDALLKSSAQQAQAMKAVEDARRALEDARDPAKAQAAAKEELAAAQKDLEAAERQLYIHTRRPSQESLDQAQANLLLAEKVLNDTLKTYQRIENKVNTNPKNYMFFESRQLYRRILDSLEIKRARDQRAYEESLKRYNNLKAPADPEDVAIAQAAVELGKAQLAQAERDWERVKDGTSPADLAVLEASLADAQRELGRWQDGPDPDAVAAARARVEAAEAALSLPRLEAPFAGQITSVSVKPGDKVSPGSLAFRLDDTSRMLVEVLVSEVDINRIKEGQAAELTFDGAPDRIYDGVVVDVPAVGEEIQDVVSFPVQVEISDFDEAIRPGMTATVTLVIDEVKDALLIPNQALRFEDGQRVVYVLRDGQFLPVPVELGATTSELSQMVAGDLQAQDQVLLNPSEALEGGGLAFRPRLLMRLQR
jgi:HlyD family secretion protein